MGDRTPAQYECFQSVQPCEHSRCDDSQSVQTQIYNNGFQQVTEGSNTNCWDGISNQVNNESFSRDVIGNLREALEDFIVSSAGGIVLIPACISTQPTWWYHASCI